MISLLCFVGAAYFWELGERRAGRRPRPTAPTNGTPVTRPGAASPQGALPLLSAPGTLMASSTNAARAALTNGLAKDRPYRLSNTTKGLEDLARSDAAVLLRNALIDTTVGAPGLEIPAALRSTVDPESYIVQARGEITPGFRQVLAGAGAEIVSYVPNNALLVRASGAVARALKLWPQTQAVLPFEPYFKLAPDLLKGVMEERELPENSLLEVVLFAGAQEQARAAFSQLGIEVLAEGRSPFGPRWLVRPRADSLATLAGLPSVQALELFRERVPANDLTRVRVRVSTNTTTAAPDGNYLGLTGQGVRVNVNDSGVDASHPDLAGRVLGDTIAATMDTTNGHGTHVAGTIAGNGSQSSTVTFASGSTNGADFRGMAPAAELFVMQSFFGGPLRSDEYLQEQAALTNALISNNSWFYPRVFEYDSHAASFDAAVRDAVPELEGPQPLVVVFAAGNAGSGNANGLGGAQDTIVSPATAKNVITVGATELPRGITNEVVINDETNAPWLGITDSDDEVAGFSSRGNTGIGEEGGFGRFKPDVMAPGTMLVSCRAADFQLPTALSQTEENIFRFLSVPPGSTNLYSISVPDNAVSFTVTVSSNSASPVPFPDLPIHMALDRIPNSGDFVANNSATLAVPALQAGVLYYSVGNPGSDTVSFDLRTAMVLTNAAGNLFDVLGGLNDQLGSFYRYESGSSMAAAAVSGLLALLQEYFQNRGLTNSPALMKALLINGAQPLSVQYGFNTRAFINHQGWGAVSLSNSLPAEVADGNSTAPVQFVEQDAANALATGFSHTRTLNLEPASRNSPLRVTLVWTDPPANPVVGVKLVNDLDLIVTNLTTGDVFVGNNFVSGSNFTLSSGTNGAITNLTANLDFVNNVENVFLARPLAASYSITVRARRVNVNSVTLHSPDAIVQDYALVVSAGTTNFGGGLRLSASAVWGGETNPIVRPYATNLVFLLNERVAANPPYIVSSNGLREQWNFYAFTNTTTFTNLAFLTFIPPNLSRARFREADIDLYVSQDPGLTNLNPLAIATADRSVGRLGSEQIIYDNAAPGAVYYVGVKSEDQQAAEFSLFALASQNPFSSSGGANGAQVVRGYAVEIPDGSPEEPGGTQIVALATMPMTIQRVVVTNLIFHEDGGDLYGNLSHGDRFAVLNNHRLWFGPGAFIYDDSGQGDIAGSQPSDGPGSLQDFLGEPAQGPWFFDISDNASFHTGQVALLDLLIEPTSTNDQFGVALTTTIAAQSWLYSAIEVPLDATNLEVCVSQNLVLVELYVRRGALPSNTAGQYDKSGRYSPPGGCLNVTPGDVPPLRPGRYYIGVFNPSGGPVTVSLTAQVFRNLQPGPLLTYRSTESMPLLDDAVTNAAIFVTNQQQVAMVQVGVRLRHERASDLVLHLISPSGTRLLLAENRGRTNAAGYGIDVSEVTTNVVGTVLENGFEAMANDVYGVPPSGGDWVSGWHVDSGQVDLVPAGVWGVEVHSGTNCLDINGWIPGGISTNLMTTPGADYLLSFAYARNPNSQSNVLAVPPVIPEASISVEGTQLLRIIADYTNTWDNLDWRTTSVVFRATSPVGSLLEVAALNGVHSGVLFDSFKVQQIELVTNLYRYVTFTEDSRLAHTPIKFAQPPFVNTNLTLSTIALSGFEGVPATNYIAGEMVEGWRVETNRVSVIDDPLLAHSGTQFLALSSAVIVTNLPTIEGNEYQVTFACRGPGEVAWWPAEGNAADIVGGYNGVFQNGATIAPGYVGDAFGLFGAPDARVSLGDPPGLALTEALTIEAWVNVDSLPGFGGQVLFRGDNRPGWDPYFLGVQPDGLIAFQVQQDINNSAVLNSPAPFVTGQWKHLAATFDHAQGSMKLYIDGDLVAQTNTAVQPFATLNPTSFPGVSIGNVNMNDPSQTFPGRIDELSLYNRALSDSEIWGIHNAAANGKFDPLTPRPNLRVEIPGLYTNTFVASSNWGLVSFTFVAPSSGTPLKLAGHPLGVLLDSMQVTETGNSYYLPEEPLTPMFGENAYGAWQLEIWDDWAGAALTNAELVSWQLQLAFVKTNPPVIPLTNCTPYTASLVSNQVLYFSVDVLCTNGFVTNTITSLPGAVEVFFNPRELPFGLVPPDDLQLSGTTLTNVFKVGVPPLVQPDRYYVAVRNLDPTASNTVTLHVEWVCTGGASASFVPEIAFAGPDAGAGAFTMAWVGPVSAKFQVQYTDSLSEPWITIPLVITSPTGWFSFSDDGLFTGPPAGTRFYRLVLLP